MHLTSTRNWLRLDTFRGGTAPQRGGRRSVPTSRCKVGQAAGGDPPECHCRPSPPWAGCEPHFPRLAALCFLPTAHFNPPRVRTAPPVSIRSAWLLERGLRRFSAAAPEPEP